MGVHLPDLHHHAPKFVAHHRDELLALPQDRPSPAAAWLRWGTANPQLLAEIDRTELLQALRRGTPGTAEHIAHALLADPDFLGGLPAALAATASGAGGPYAVSRLLEVAAGAMPRRATEDSALLAAGETIWRAAVEADLPAGSLAGAGAYADTGLSDSTWARLTRASAEHTPALRNADAVAERATTQPRNPDALHTVALLLTRRAPAWQDLNLRRHAWTLLKAAAALPEGERPDGLRELREALINAGDVAAARV